MRMQLFEIEDLKGLPRSIRNGMTNYMRFLENRFNLYGAVVPRFLKAFKRMKGQRVVDLCSGAGGAWERILRNAKHRRSMTSGAHFEIHLTDLFPNKEGQERLRRSYPEIIRTHPESVDALCPPSTLKGFFTMFASFHHFRPEAAQAILQNAVKNGNGIGIFEMTQRHPLYFLFMLTVPFQIFLLTPFIRPFRASQWFWTYLIPVIPFAITFDGIVSGLRTYSKKELSAMILNLPRNHYQWEVGLLRFGPLPVGLTYALGYPAAGPSEMNVRTSPSKV